MVVYALQIVFSILGSLVVCYFSRGREFRADAGGAALAGKTKMLAGLKALQARYGAIDGAHPSLATLKFSGRKIDMLKALSTHPPLEERIQKLQESSIGA